MKIQKFTQGQLLDMPLALQSTVVMEEKGVSARRSQALTMEGRGHARFGVWEASVGTFNREVELGEIMHILIGSAVFTDDSGHAVEMNPGDTLVFAPNTRGTWVVKEPIRKLYVLV